MPTVSEATLKLKDYLLFSRPISIPSADSLARKFNMDPKSVRNTLERAHYVKEDDGPVWSLQGTQNINAVTLTMSKEILERLIARLPSDAVPNNTRTLTIECGEMLGFIFNTLEDQHITLDTRGFSNSKSERIILPEPESKPKAENYYDDAETDVVDTDPRELYGVDEVTTGLSNSYREHLKDEAKLAEFKARFPDDDEETEEPELFDPETAFDTDD